MPQIDTPKDQEQIRKIINKFMLADVAFDLEDEQLAKSLTHDSLCQLADYYTPYEDYTQLR